jgi:hypothetical protein
MYTSTADRKCRLVIIHAHNTASFALLVHFNEQTLHFNEQTLMYREKETVGGSLYMCQRLYLMCPRLYLSTSSWP